MRARQERKELIIMKKIIAVLCAVLCLTMACCAFAEDVIRPELPSVVIPSEVLANRSFSIDPVAGENENSLRMFIYEPVAYAKAALAELKVGDFLDLAGTYCEIATLEMDGEDYVINKEAGTSMYLHADENNPDLFIAHSTDDDYIFWNRLGMTEAAFAADFVFTDLSDPDRAEPVVGDLAAFRAAWETSYFNPDNLSVQFNEKGEIAQIIFTFSPNS